MKTWQLRKNNRGISDNGTYKEAQNQENIGNTGVLCKLQAEIQKKLNFKNAISRHANLTNFTICRIPQKVDLLSTNDPKIAN